ncbi:MAG: 50S ribosomal protein L16 [archaeon]|nr:50S ribosomal protein L16 [archaeon]
MAIRKALSYSHKVCRPYTRKAKTRGKDYIKTIPQIKIAKFHIGNHQAFREGKHPFNIRLISEQRVQIRDNAIEAARMFLTKMLDEKMLNQYYLAVKVYPHHMMRENKSAGGMAGADRISSGMTQSYGIVIGRAAIVRPGQDIFFVSCIDEKCAREARDLLITIKAKMPCRTRVIFEKLKQN